MIVKNELYRNNLSHSTYINPNVRFIKTATSEKNECSKSKINESKNERNTTTVRYQMLGMSMLTVLVIKDVAEIRQKQLIYKTLSEGKEKGVIRLYN